MIDLIIWYVMIGCGVMLGQIGGLRTLGLEGWVQIAGTALAVLTIIVTWPHFVHHTLTAVPPSDPQ